MVWYHLQCPEMLPGRVVFILPAPRLPSLTQLQWFERPLSWVIVFCIFFHWIATQKINIPFQGRQYHIKPLHSNKSPFPPLLSQSQLTEILYELWWVPPVKHKVKTPCRVHLLAGGVSLFFFPLLQHLSVLTRKPLPKSTDRNSPKPLWDTCILWDGSECKCWAWCSSYGW